jgi:hypothetical protein
MERFKYSVFQAVSNMNRKHWILGGLVAAALAYGAHCFYESGKEAGIEIGEARCAEVAQAQYQAELIDYLNESRDDIYKSANKPNRHKNGANSLNTLGHAVDTVILMIKHRPDSSRVIRTRVIEE